MKTHIYTWLVLFAIFVLCPARPAFSVSIFEVTINTQAVSGKPGKLAFDLVSGDPTANQVSILNFSTDGTLGLPETEGGLVDGDIILGVNPAPFTRIEDDFFFNQLVQPFQAFGNQIAFTLQLTENHGTVIPDELTVLLLHNIDNPAKPLIGTTDPLHAHALFTIDITGASGGLLNVFSPAQLTAPSTLTVVVPSLADMVAAILPSSRSVQVGTAATAFVIMINASPSITVLDAGPSLSTPPVTFTFQTTDPATNAPIGTPDTLVDIPPGGNQTFVVSLTPTDPFPPEDVAFNFSAINASLVSAIPGVNTLLLSASADPVPDIVALAATLPPDPGIVNIPGATGSGVFAVATVNVGIGGLITASADTGAATLPISLFVCQTNPQTGACLALPALSVTTQIDANATPTFSIFAPATGIVPFDPATNRAFVRFKDVGEVTRGSTSVALRTTL